MPATKLSPTPFFYYICNMDPNEIIDKFVRVVKVHYMNHTVSGTFSYCIRVEVEFLHPIMYVNGWDDALKQIDAVCDELENL